MTLRRLGIGLGLALAPGLFAFAGSGPARAGELCVQTFNVYGPVYASDTAWRLGMAGRALAAEGCEAIQLQELWRPAQYEIFRRALGPARYAGLRADERRADGKLTGLGSFFAGAVRNAQTGLYRANNGPGLLDRVRERSCVRKGFTIAEVAFTGAPALLFVNTHLHPTDPATRAAQVLELARALYADPAAAEHALLFTADLNAEPDGPEYALLRDLLLLRDAYREVHAGYGEACTYCRSNVYSWLRRDLVMDYVLFRSGAGARLAPEHAEINLRGAGHPWSDHYGVRADFTTERNAGPLAEDDPLVRLRMRRAADTLSRTVALLANRRDEAATELRNYAATLGAELARGSLPEALRASFLTPP